MRCLRVKFLFEVCASRNGPLIVRAWLLKRIALALPGIAPVHLDICAAIDEPSILVDFGFALKALLKDKPTKATATWQK